MPFCNLFIGLPSYISHLKTKMSLCLAVSAKQVSLQLATEPALANKTLPANSLPPNMAATNFIKVKCHFTAETVW